MIDHALLARLMEMEATTGDESRLADFLTAHLGTHAPGANVDRIGDTLIVLQGKPRVAVFAHIDSVGFTLAGRNRLIPIGHPDPADGTPIRYTDGSQCYRGRLRVLERDEEDLYLLEGEGPLASRWVYDTAPDVAGVQLNGAYLDNRFGVYNALRLLTQGADVAVAFTVAEEVSGRGAFDAARRLYENTGIRQALISDITWATEETPPGRGPAVSLRDAHIPRKVFLDRVLDGAAASGVPHQFEIQSGGSSDGGMLERAGFGIDWVFVGAPETGYHSAQECLRRDDAENMLRLYEFLVEYLNR
jgi:putative aminopeptidase FrvX